MPLSQSLTETPCRISLIGGGTDLPDFFKSELGACVSVTIDQFIKVKLETRQDHSFALQLGEHHEVAPHIHEIQHLICKQALLDHYHLPYGLNVQSHSPIPPGSGLGSSSSFTVGLLRALAQLQNIPTNPRQLAKQAINIEISKLHGAIGVQDQIAAAFTGFNLLTFAPRCDFTVQPIHLSTAYQQQLQASMLLLYTHLQRSASSIYSGLQQNVQLRLPTLRKMRDLAFQLCTELKTESSIQTIGELLHQSWLLKRELASTISSERLDLWYERGMKAGAYGGKILGAGGGGFFLFMAPPELHPEICRELKELTPWPMKLHLPQIPLS